MIKKTVAVLALAAFPLSALADKDVGCGLGTQVWKGQSGVVPKVLAATTNGTFGNQTFGITTGTLGCSSDGVITGANRLPAYAAANLDALTVEIAAGQGESLASLASLYGVEQADRAAFNTALKSGYAEIFASDAVTAGEFVARVNAVLARDARLARYVA